MKGMRKIRRGRGFKGLLSYLLDHDEPKLIFGTISFGSVDDMTREFVALSKTRKDIEKPVWHNALRLPSGEHLSDEKWSVIAYDYIQMMGFSDSAQYIVIKQHKKEGEHIHIAANRIAGAPGGGIYVGKNENLKSTRIIAELEKKYGLEITKNIDYDNEKVVMPERASMSKNEIEKSLRTGTAPVRAILQNVIDEALVDTPDLHDFTERLFLAGITVKPNIASTGRVNGLAFGLNGITFSGAKLGRKYAWNQLKKQVDYDRQRDNQLLQKLKKTAKKNDENRASQKGLRDAISINSETSKDRERLGSHNDWHHEKVETVISNTQSKRKDFSNRPKQDNQPTQQIKLDDGSYGTPSGHNHINDFISIKKEALNMQNDTEIKRKKRLLHDNELFTITGKTPSNLDPDEIEKEQRQFLKTLDLVFDKRGNEYFHKTTGKLAFVEHSDRITGHAGLLNKDGSQNMIAHKAMAQAAKLKFGVVFRSSGSDDYVRASWLAAAMIGCNDVGLEPEPKDCEALLQMMREHANKYQRPPSLHPAIQKILDEHRANISFTKKHMRTASGGKSEAEEAAEEAQRIKNSSKYRGNSIGNMVDRFRKNNESEKPNHNFDREHHRK